MKPEHILIVGVGALGCLFAARLSAAGIPVSMLGHWPEAVGALHELGVRVQSRDGSLTAYPVRMVSESAEKATFRLALVLVKSWQTKQAGMNLAEWLAPDGLALSLQNGLGNREALVSVLGNHRAAVGVTTYGASIISPGVVLPAGEGVVTLESRPELDVFASFFSAAGFEVARTQDLAGLQWGKLVVSAAINPLTAILDVPNGRLIERPAARALLGELAIETAGVAYASGIRLPYADPVAVVEAVAETTADNISSMLQDVRRGAQTEVDAINGAVTAQAAAQGISAPLNWSMWQMVQALHQKGFEQEQLRK